MDNDEPYVVIGKLYSDLYRAKSVLMQMQAQVQERDQYLNQAKIKIQSLEQELSKHKTTIEDFKNLNVVHNEPEST